MKTKDFADAIRAKLDKNPELKAAVDHELDLSVIRSWLLDLPDEDFVELSDLFGAESARREGKVP